MRIAICIAGMPRHYDKCAQSILDFFSVEGVETDFFIHSWVNVRHKNSVALSEPFQYEEGFLKGELQKIYNPKKILIEDQLNQTQLQKDFECLRNTQAILQNFHENAKHARDLWIEEITENAYSSRTLPMTKGYKMFLEHYHMGQMYSIEQAAKLRSRYEKENNFKYDLVFRFRFDTLIKKQQGAAKQLLKKAKDRNKKCKTLSTSMGVLYTRWIKFYGPVNHVGDDFFGGDSEVFDFVNKIYKYQLNRIIKLMANSSDVASLLSSCDSPLKTIVPTLVYEWVTGTPELTLSYLCQENNLIVDNTLGSVGILRYLDKHKEEEDQSWDNLIKVNPKI